MASGTIINNSGSYTLDIEHGLGVKPNLIMIMANPYTAGQFVTSFYAENENVNVIYGTNSSSSYTNAYLATSSNLATMNVDESKISLPEIAPTANSYGTKSLYIGVTKWIAIAE